MLQQFCWHHFLAFLREPSSQCLNIVVICKPIAFHTTQVMPFKGWFTQNSGCWYSFLFSCLIMGLKHALLCFLILKGFFLASCPSYLIDNLKWYCHLQVWSLYWYQHCCILCCPERIFMLAKTHHNISHNISQAMKH